MKERLTLVLSAVALLIALFGATPLGEAAGRALTAVPPFAKKSGYATTAGYAKNAGAVGGFKASRRPVAGRLLVLGANGKFPPSVGAVGPRGDKGDPGSHGDPGQKGDRGDPGAPGLSGLEVVSGSTATNGADDKSINVTCPSNKKLIGGGALTGGFSGEFEISNSYPDAGSNRWVASASETNAFGGGSWSLKAYAFCAIVAS